MKFSTHSNYNLFQATLFKNKPVYVQFYITARCNLTCEQCNIIYANSDLEECNIDKIKLIADNLKKIGVAIVLLTGGEPYLRKDLPEIIQTFTERGIHVRMQTNGFATEEMIYNSIKAGGKDISISLDSINPNMQDKINGGFEGSWEKALKTISYYTKYLPKDDSFASLGCVLSPRNIDEIEKVIKFSTSINWYTSLVPIHTTSLSNPMGFRTFDKFVFSNEDKKKIVELIKKIKSMKKNNYLLYDSDKYLDDIVKFTHGEPVTWREKNENVCDSPNLYFAILPNGSFAPCCDHRLNKNYFVFEDQFVQNFNKKIWRSEVHDVTSKCEGCMYGSYPEITISMRYAMAKIQRIKTFMIQNNKKNWPKSYEQIINIANKINNNAKENII